MNFARNFVASLSFASESPVSTSVYLFTLWVLTAVLLYRSYALTLVLTLLLLTLVLETGC
jgi:hypothetical protein